VSTHSTEIQRNITEEAGVWSLKGEKKQCRHPDGNERANNDLDRAALLAKLDGDGGGSPKRSVHTQAGGWRRESK
jgi:hypothetical protein